MPRPRPRTVLAAWAGTALLAAAAWTILALRAADGRGFLLQVDGGPPLATLEIDLAEARTLAAGPTFEARWSGVWRLDEALHGRLQAGLRGSTTVRVDGTELLAEAPADSKRRLIPLELAAGDHLLEIEHRRASADGSELRLTLLLEKGLSLRPPEWRVYTSTPGPRAARAEDAVRVTGAVVIVLWLGLIFAVPGLVFTGHLRPSWISVPALLAAVVLAYGAALRVEALACKYPAGAPAWTRALAPWLQDLHPRALRFTPPEYPYLGDPFGYLRLARETPHFYDASVREPVFVFLTKAWLPVVGGADIAVSLASMTGSLLLVWATYLLGARAASPWTGLLAAAALAIEREVVTQSVDGWRDDTFAAMAVFATWGLLRLREHPSHGNAVVAGVLAGLACLTRITSLSFLVPGLIAVFLFGPSSRRAHLRAVLVAGGVAVLLVAPFLLACAAAYGDPFHSINAHTRFYRFREGGTAGPPVAWYTYLLQQAGVFHQLDTLLVGVTSYPFTNKWDHFDAWSVWLGPLLAAFAVAGLALWTRRPVGRFLLLVLLSSLLPYAFTWDVPGGGEWRFTLHAYPFYLIAGFAVPFALAQALSTGALREGLRWCRTHPARAVAWAAAAVAIGGLTWLGASALAYLRVREDVARGRGALVTAGWRDGFFFEDGWGRPRRSGRAGVRPSSGDATIDLPLVADRDSRLALRLAAAVAPVTVAVSLDGRPLATLDLPAPGGRLVPYPIDVPAAATGRGRLRLQADGPFELWSVRIEPPAARGAITAPGSPPGGR